MDRDLDTPGGVDLLFRQVREANTALDAGDAAAAGRAAATAREIAGAVGLELRRGGDEVPAEVQALAEERQAARAAKDWARADELRDQITAAGFTVEDTPTAPSSAPAPAEPRRLPAARLSGWRGGRRWPTRGGDQVGRGQLDVEAPASAAHVHEVERPG